MILYLIVALILLALILFYFRIAKRFNIIDKPNQRSSHTFHTIRGGGIIFPAAAIIWSFATGFSQHWIILALIVLAVISFLDDLKGVSSRLRFSVHIIAIIVLFWQLHFFENPIYIILVGLILSIGWINAFNFMDGINAITPFYSLVTLSTFFWLNQQFSFASEELIIILIISVMIFSWFNARKKAKIFAGDVGSVSMAFLLTWLMIMLIIKTGHPAYILLFAVYGIDSSMTIIIRLIRQENIFQAHRSHLYQYFANELGVSHILVSSVYSIVQLFVNLLIVCLITNNKMTLAIFIFLLLILSIIYLTIRLLVNKQIGFR